MTTEFDSSKARSSLGAKSSSNASTNASTSANTKESLRREFSAQIRECLVLRDWSRMEHWARQWIQFEPKSVNGFKWLARASLGLQKNQKAAYAYGRVLDFEADNEEALQFFADYPSTLQKDTGTLNRVKESDRRSEQSSKTRLSLDQVNSQSLTPEQRRTLSHKCIELGDLYFQTSLFAQAAKMYEDSFNWEATHSAALGVARSLHRAQQSAKAVQFLKRCLERQPNWIAGRLLLGKTLFEMGQSAEAQRNWQHVLRLEPDNKEALNHLRNLV